MNTRLPDSNQQISDELINAFIDRQITQEERHEILLQIRQDKGLSDRVCELQHLKEITQNAFDKIPQPPSSKQQESADVPRKVAAFAIFCIGLLLGLAGMQFNNEQTTDSAQATQNSVTKVLVHLTSDNVDSGLNTLNNLQQLLDHYAQKQQQVIVEVVANGDGIKLLDTKNIAIAKRIRELTALHANLSFAACKNTIDQMRITKGLHIQLIPQVKMIDSGVVKVIERQSQGWTYIRG